MAQANSPFGLQPVGSLMASPYSGQVMRCYLSTALGTAMGIGDPVDFLGTADTPGFTPEVTLATAGASHPIWGVIVGFDINTDNVFQNYRKASEARYCYVCVDPFMVYEVQGDATVIAATAVGANALLTSAAVSTSTGLSGWVLNGTTTPANDTTYQVLILGAANRPNNDITAAYAIWRVMISLKRGIVTTAATGALGVQEDIMAGGTITTGNIPAAHWPGVHAFCMAEYNEFPTEYTDLFNTETSKMSFEKDVAFTSFGLAKVKTQGGSVDYDSETQDYSVTYQHLTIGLGFIVTREEYDDNLYEAVGKRRAKRLGRSMRMTTEIFAAGLYNLGFGTTNPYFTTGDAVAIFSASHPTKAGLQSNNPVNADISETALEAINVAIMSAVDGRGMPVNLIGESLHIHPANWYEANRILKSVLQNDTANNAINVLKSTNAFQKGIKMNHNFTSTGAYFVRTNAPNGPTHFLRRELEITRENDFDTENLKTKATKREIFGITEFRGIYASSPS